jgi:hypothetical protein
MPRKDVRDVNGVSSAAEWVEAGNRWQWNDASTAVKERPFKGRVGGG